MMKTLFKTMKKTINLRKTLKITKHLKVIENKYNSIISSQNMSSINQSNDNSVPQKIICKLNQNKMTGQLMQQIKEGDLKINETYKSSLSNKLLKELQKQIELITKFKIENDILKKMHFFKCCCAKKSCKTTKLKVNKKAKQTCKVNKVKRATQLQLLDEDNNSISFDHNPIVINDMPESDESSMFNEKSMIADQKSSNCTIVSPFEIIRNKKTVAPPKEELKIPQNVFPTESESLPSKFDKLNYLQKTQRNDLILDRTNKKVKDELLEPIERTNKETHEINNFSTTLDDSMCLTKKKKKKEARKDITEFAKSIENSKGNNSVEVNPENFESQENLGNSFCFTQKKKKKGSRKTKIDSTKFIEKSNINESNSEMIYENFELEDSFGLSQIKKKKARACRTETFKLHENQKEYMNNEEISDNFDFEDNLEESFGLSQIMKKEGWKSKIEFFNPIEKPYKNQNTDLVHEKLESQEKIEDLFGLSQEKKKNTWEWRTETSNSNNKAKDNIYDGEIPDNFKSQKTKEKKVRDNIIEHPNENITNNMIPKYFESQKETKKSEPEPLIYVKDVRQNVTESLITIDKVIEEINNETKDKQDIAFDRKPSKENKPKVVNSKISKLQKYVPKIITKELINEGKLHLGINNNEDADSNDSFTEINEKLMKKNSKSSKENKTAIDLKNNINIKNVEDEFLQPKTPAVNPKIKSKKPRDTTTEMNISIERNNKRLRVPNESANDIVNLTHVSRNLVENKKKQEICRKVELYKKYDPPWVNEFMELSWQSTFPKPDEVIFEESSSNEADEAKLKKNQVKKFRNRSTQTHGSPNLSPIPRI